MLRLNTKTGQTEGSESRHPVATVLDTLIFLPVKQTPPKRQHL
ncbi:MAG TPA: hypothetical protein ACHBZA_15655 [Arsenophonus apicola]|nr:hypothetical protein [Arsenophonus apicola]